MIVVVCSGKCGKFKLMTNEKRLLKMFENGAVHLLGSDGYNVSSRALNLLCGREVIRKKFGKHQFDIVDNIGIQILGL